MHDRWNAEDLIQIFKLKGDCETNLCQAVKIEVFPAIGFLRDVCCNNNEMHQQVG